MWPTWWENSRVCSTWVYCRWWSLVVWWTEPPVEGCYWWRQRVEECRVRRCASAALWFCYRLVWLCCLSSMSGVCSGAGGGCSLGLSLLMVILNVMSTYFQRALVTVMGSLMNIRKQRRPIRVLQDPTLRMQGVEVAPWYLTTWFFSDRTQH